MFSDLIAAFISFFLLGPVQNEVQSRIDSLRPAAAVVDQLRSCLATAGPAMVERATNDPTWAISQAVGVTFGWSDPLAVLSEAHPECKPALRQMTQDRGEDGELGI